MDMDADSHLPRIAKPIADGLQLVIWEGILVVPSPARAEHIDDSLRPVSCILPLGIMQIGRCVCGQGEGGGHKCREGERE